MDASPFAVSHEGTLAACGDGPEVLVYLTTSGAPVWKAFADGILVGLAFDGSRLLGLDANGRLYLWEQDSGQLDQQHELGMPARGMSLAADGSILVGAENGAHLVVPGGLQQHWPMACPTAVEWMGQTAVVGTADGIFTRVSRQSGSQPVSNLGGPIADISASPLGSWVVASGARISLLERDGSKALRVLDLPGDSAVRNVAVSMDGIVIAASRDDGTVWLGDSVNLHKAGEIRSRRPVEGLRFGHGLLLNVMHDDGDASMLDLSSREIVQSEAHMGRARRAWHIEVDVDLAGVRGARVNVASGGEDVATYTGPRPDKERPSWGKWLLGLTGGCLVLVLGTGALVVISGLVLRSRGL